MKKTFPSGTSPVPGLSSSAVKASAFRFSPIFGIPTVSSKPNGTGEDQWERQLMAESSFCTLGPAGSTAAMLPFDSHRGSVWRYFYSLFTVRETDKNPVLTAAVALTLRRAYRLSGNSDKQSFSNIQENSQGKPAQ